MATSLTDTTPLCEKSVLSQEKFVTLHRRGQALLCLVSAMNKEVGDSSESSQGQDRPVSRD